MRTHIEYDDFGEYLESFDGSSLVVVEEYTAGSTVELILFDEAVS